MSNMKGFTTLVASTAPQTLTTDFVILGEQFNQPDVNQCCLLLDYTAGTEDGLSVVLRHEDTNDDGENYNQPAFEAVGGGESLVTEEVVKIAKAQAGNWMIPFDPKGRKKWSVFVEGYGSAASGTVSAFVRFTDI